MHVLRELVKGGKIMPFIVGVLVFAAIFFFVAMAGRKNLKKQAKIEELISDEILKEDLVEGMTDLSFNKNAGLKNEFLRRIKILHCDETIRHFGLLEGNYKDTRFLADSVYLSDGTQNPVTRSFNGLVIVFDLSLTDYDKPTMVCHEPELLDSRAVPILEDPPYYASSENDTLKVNGDIIEFIKGLKDKYTIDDHEVYNFEIHKGYLVLTINNDEDMLFSFAHESQTKNELREYVSKTLQSIADIVDFFIHGEDKKVLAASNADSTKCSSCGANLVYSDNDGGGLCCPYCGVTVRGAYREARGDATKEDFRNRFVEEIKA